MADDADPPVAADPPAPGIYQPGAYNFEYGELWLMSRSGRPIPNFFDKRPLNVGQEGYCAAKKYEHQQTFHRSTEVTAAYNCHGLTFASRRTGIVSAAIVRQILADDEFQPVVEGDVQVGDVAIYVADKDGDIEHSGTVVGVDRGSIGSPTWILSKWGDCHEAIHRPKECPYPNSTVQYWRIVR